MNQSNSSENFIEINSNHLLGISTKIEIFATICVITIGLIGNSLTIFVFGQKRFRKNSTNVYLFCLALNDSMFLIIHFFEDTIRTFISFNEYIDSNFIQALNIINHHDFLCRAINYLRNVLRFISAYVIVAFTMQRLSLVYKPLSINFRSKKSAWKTVGSIVIIALLINTWVPFLFQIDDVSKQCHVKNSFTSEYFYIIIVYTSVVMLLPIITVLVCNSLIIYKTRKAEKERKELQIINLSYCSSSNRSSLTTENLLNFKDEITVQSSKKSNFLNVKQVVSNIRSLKNPMNSSHKLANSLHVISFSYAFFNFPYLISWFTFFYLVAFDKITEATYSYLLSAVKLFEVLYIFTYSFKFYVFCISGTKFREQLKSSSKFLLNYSFKIIHLNFLLI